MEDSPYVLMSRPKPGHRNLALKIIADRYVREEFKYVLILHLDNKDHCITGLFNSVRECLMARYYANSGLGPNFGDDKFFQAHQKDGSVIEVTYDANTDTIQ